MKIKSDAACEAEIYLGEELRSMIEGNGRQWVLISKGLALYGTPEAKVLFDQWVSEMEQAVLKFIRENGTVEPQKIAEHLNISPDSALFFLDRLMKGDKLKVGRD